VHPHSTARERELRDEPDAGAVLTGLYERHALALIRLAYVMLGDRQGAEDVVQDAFAGLYRRWDQLADQAKAVPYLRASVLNGCRSAIRRLPQRQRETLVLRFYLDEPDTEIARLIGVRESPVRSTTHRALAALGRRLRGTLWLAVPAVRGT
jgi:DNA-directed RNA polymerase specialized sigma24 family protein